MQYALMIYAEPGYGEALPDAERAAVRAEFSALADDARCVAGAQLQPAETATCVRVAGGRTLMTDGPFADTKEVLGGFVPDRGGQPGRGDRGGGAHPGCPARRRGGGQAGGGALSVLEEVFRDEWGRVLASLVGFLGDFDKAEEAAQEAFAIAAERWPASGVPPNPGAWLVTTARNRAIDRIRRERTLAEKIHLLPEPEAVMDEFDDTVIKDERLELIFTCCHPALPLDGQVALTLRALGGLETAEIARAFLVSEETMKRRLSRAKAKIKATGIPFAVPDAHLLPDRLDAVLAVIYLIYNEGYSGRVDLAAEAIRLGRVLAALMPDEPEAHGLLALMMIHHARRRARFSGEDLVLLDDQDRSLWDMRRSRRGGRCSTGRSRWAGAAPTSSRRRSRRCRPPSGSTGRRSPSCTGVWPNSPARRWSSSTTPWRSPRPVTPPRRCAPSTASTWTATSTSTRPAASCCGVSAATPRPGRRTAGRWSWPPRPPSGGS